MGGSEEKGTALVSGSLTHLPEKKEQGIVGSSVWYGLTRIQQHPEAILSLYPLPTSPYAFPIPPELWPECRQQMAASSPRHTVKSKEDSLTSQGVLGHTEAQGLQPVVDVRFSHRKLEFCKGQRVILVIETLRTRRRYARCCGAPPRLPWSNLGGSEDQHGGKLHSDFNQPMSLLGARNPL